MKSLVLTSRPIKLLRHGYDLRVANLCSRMPGERHWWWCRSTRKTGVRPPSIPLTAFDTVETLPPCVHGPQVVAPHGAPV
jgi:hypothetical protein